MRFCLSWLVPPWHPMNGTAGFKSRGSDFLWELVSLNFKWENKDNLDVQVSRVNAMFATRSPGSVPGHIRCKPFGTSRLNLSVLLLSEINLC